MDQLVHLLESPAFAGLRLRLAEPDRHPNLFRALYALLMILPQSAAFRTLRARLDAAPSGRSGPRAGPAETPDASETSDARSSVKRSGRSDGEDAVSEEDLAAFEATLGATRKRHVAAARARARRSWTATPL